MSRALCSTLLLLLATHAAHAAPARRKIAITVDDLPISSGALHPSPDDRRRITDGLLSALAKHHVKAVAVVTGRNVRGPADEKLLERWLDAGHELGNHSETHPSYTETSSSAYIADVERGRTRLARLLEARKAPLRFFRFPFLREGDTPAKLQAMRAYLEISGQRNLVVTIDDQDWSFEEPWVVASRRGDRHNLGLVGCDYQAALRLAVRHHESRSDKLFGRPVPQVLLLHANEIGAAEWDELFGWLEDTGHDFATIDEVLADPAYREPHQVVAPFGYGLWDRLRQERKEKAAKQEVEAIIAKQVEAWNRGDVTAFTSVYADDATFISPSGLTKGRKAVRDRYLARYPDKAAMGTLALEPIEWRAVQGVEVDLGGDAFPGRVQALSLIARWTLRYPAPKPAAAGLTQLLLRPRGDRWEIVEDASM